MKKISIAILAVIGGLLLAAQENKQDTEPEGRPSPLVGQWAGILTMGRPGPTQITTITINEDGTYHWLDIEIDPGKTDLKDPTSYLPNGANVRHSTGWIDLKTGKEKITDASRKLSVESITWSLKDGQLNWYTDMGNMGGEGLTFSQVR